jgi:hypothetical protein
MFKLDNNTIAIGCVTLIVIVGTILKVEGVKDIANVAIGGLVGFLAGKTTEPVK